MGNFILYKIKNQIKIKIHRKLFDATFMPEASKMIQGYDFPIEVFITPRIGMYEYSDINGISYVITKISSVQCMKESINENYIIHFGKKFSKSIYGFKISRDSYATIKNKSSFGDGIVYSPDECQLMQQAALENFDLNMKFFQKLDKNDFNASLEKYIQKYKFKPCDYIQELDGVSGIYMLVLDEYKQVYIGKSDDIKRRLIEHMTQQKDFDRLVFGDIETSRLSVDSFRPLDFTRIYYTKIRKRELDSAEEKMVSDFEDKYVLNRTKGGFHSGLAAATIDMKKRKLIEED